MKNMRLLGNMIEKLAKDNNISTNDLSLLLQCSNEQIEALYKGRIFLSFRQLSQIAEYFNISITELLNGDKKYYEKYYDGEFENVNNREEILDIIDDYLNLKAVME